MSRLTHSRNTRFLRWLKRPRNSKIQRFNESVATKVTMVFGTMWTCYVFFAYGFLPLIFPQFMNQFMYWSTTVQLWSLPLIMVGQGVMGRASEIRAQETYEAEMNEISMIKEDLIYDKKQQQDAKQERDELRKEAAQIRNLLNQMDSKNH